MTMQKVKSYVFVAAMAVSAASCGSVVRDGRSPVYMVIEQLSGSRGASTPGPYGGTLLSDVVTNVTTRRQLQHHESLPDDLQRPRPRHPADAAEGHRHGDHSRAESQQRDHGHAGTA